MLHKESLFKSFSQVDESITRLYGGSGLGLAMYVVSIYSLAFLLTLSIQALVRSHDFSEVMRGLIQPATLVLAQSFGFPLSPPEATHLDPHSSSYQNQQVNTMCFFWLLHWSRNKYYTPTFVLLDCTAPSSTAMLLLSKGYRAVQQMSQS